MKRNVFLMAVLAIVLAFSMAFIACDDGSGNGGGGISGGGIGNSTSTWKLGPYETYIPEHSTFDSASSPTSLNASESSGAFTMTGNLNSVDDNAWMEVVPRNSATLNKLRATQSISFKAKGDGRTYILILPTSDIDAGSCYQKTFTATSAGETITMDISDFAQPDYAKQVPFNQSKLDSLLFEVHGNMDGTGPFSLTISDLALDGDGDDDFTYTITGSGTSFTATNSRGTTVGTANQSIGNVLSSIRAIANGADIAIQFGKGAAALDIGTDSIVFDSASGKWGKIALSGKIKSANALQTIGLNGNVSINSTADIENSSSANTARAIDNIGGTLAIGGGTVSGINMAIGNQKGGTININSGLLFATGAGKTAISSLLNDLGTINVNGGTIEARGLDGIGISGFPTTNIKGGTIETKQGGRTLVNNGALNISNGTVKSTLGTLGSKLAAAIANESGTANISGGTIEAISGPGGAAYAIQNLAKGSIAISGGTIKATGEGSKAVKNDGGTVKIDPKVAVTGEIEDGGGGDGETVPPSVVPKEIEDKFKKDMPIYSGSNPPDISGQYLMDNCTLVGSSISGDTIGSSKYADMYVAFIKGANGKLSYREKQGSSEAGNDNVVVEIVGSGNNFTAYFVADGTSNGISTKMSTIISGTMTSSGISNFHYAFVMVAKGPDPSSKLVPVNTYRIFKDGDGLAAKNNWWTGNSGSGNGNSVTAIEGAWQKSNGYQIRFQGNNWTYGTSARDFIRGTWTSGTTITIPSSGTLTIVATETNYDGSGWVPQSGFPSSNTITYSLTATTLTISDATEKTGRWDETVGVYQKH